MSLKEIAKPPKARLISEIVLFSALSGIGAMIPIPSPVGSVALDSFPGYFMALWRGTTSGALVCAIGHLLSSIRSGFPLGYLHIPVILLMMMVGAATALMNRKFGVVAGLASGIAINTAGAVLAVPAMGWEVLPMLTPILFVASLINASAAGMVYEVTKKIIKG
ncbi:MAG: ECF transporter S component [Candidatus Bathyarchaeota archaeon]|nr:ECF transporter S component [Candidatus Bathyarchaeota archaeon]MCX8177487.1 ECF transporter S component [Candidatus Bathyarchaeota archaeon]MDW8194154.1 ECF transporter S component [Nitrososphaerota archaeon]